MQLEDLLSLLGAISGGITSGIPIAIALFRGIKTLAQHLSDSFVGVIAAAVQRTNDISEIRVAQRDIEHELQSIGENVKGLNKRIDDVFKLVAER